MENPNIERAGWSDEDRPEKVEIDEETYPDDDEDAGKDDEERGLPFTPALA